MVEFTSCSTVFFVGSFCCILRTRQVDRVWDFSVLLDLLRIPDVNEPDGVVVDALLDVVKAQSVEAVADVNAPVIHAPILFYKCREIVRQNGIEGSTVT